MPLDQIDVDSLDVDEKVNSPEEMSFLDHLEELRWHIIRAVASILIIAIVVFVLKNFIFENIVCKQVIQQVNCFLFVKAIQRL